MLSGSQRLSTVVVRPALVVIMYAYAGGEQHAGEHPAERADQQCWTSAEAGRTPSWLGEYG
jgi:hypothetical protein